MFADTPVEFIPRKGNQLDEKIEFYIQELELKFPIELIKGDLYLVGTERLTIKQDTDNDSLMVRVGGGYTNFEDHVLKQDRTYQRQLVINMIKSGESLEWVIDQLKLNKKIPNTFLNESTQYAGGYSPSGRRSSLTPASKSPTAYANRANRFENSGSAFGSSTPTGRSSAYLRKSIQGTYRHSNLAKWEHVDHYIFRKSEL